MNAAESITMGTVQDTFAARAIDRDAAARTHGNHKFISPPPPGLRGSLVVVCALGVLLAVLVVERAALAWHSRHVPVSMPHETAQPRLK